MTTYSYTVTFNDIQVIDLTNMINEKIKGTLKIWPGVAEELVATKAYFVRDGYFTQ